MSRLHFGAGLAVAMLLAGSLDAQLPDESVTAVVRKNRVPVNSDIPRVNLPRATETTLSNGLTVLLLEDHRIPRIAVTYLVAGAGPTHSPAASPGLAGVVAQMLREGTMTRSRSAIDAELERLGARLATGGAFGPEAASITMTGLSDNFEQWVAVAQDVVANPTFPPEEVERAKRLLKTLLVQQRSTSAFLATERFTRALYGSHPAAEAAVTAATADALTSEQLTRWHRERYVPQRTIIGIAGDINVKDLLPKLEKWFGQWNAKGSTAASLPAVQRASQRKAWLIDRPGSVQTSFMIR